MPTTSIAGQPRSVRLRSATKRCSDAPRRDGWSSACRDRERSCGSKLARRARPSSVRAPHAAMQRRRKLAPAAAATSTRSASFRRPQRTTRRLRNGPQPESAAGVHRARPPSVSDVRPGRRANAPRPTSPRPGTPTRESVSNCGQAPAMDTAASSSRSQPSSTRVRSALSAEAQAAAMAQLAAAPPSRGPRPSQSASSIAEHPASAPDADKRASMSAENRPRPEARRFDSRCWHNSAENKLERRPEPVTSRSRRDAPRWRTAESSRAASASSRSSMRPSRSCVTGAVARPSANASARTPALRSPRQPERQRSERDVRQEPPSWCASSNSAAVALPLSAQSSSSSEPNLAKRSTGRGMYVSASLPLTSRCCSSGSELASSETAAESNTQPRRELAPSSSRVSPAQRQMASRRGAVRGDSTTCERASWSSRPRLRQQSSGAASSRLPLASSEVRVGWSSAARTGCARADSCSVRRSSKESLHNVCNSRPDLRPASGPTCRCVRLAAGRSRPPGDTSDMLHSERQERLTASRHALHTRARLHSCAASPAAASSKTSASNASGSTAIKQGVSASTSASSADDMR